MQTRVIFPSVKLKNFKLVLNGINKHTASFSELRIYGTRGVRPLGTEKHCFRLVFPCQYHSTNTPYSLPNASVYQGTPGSLLPKRCSVEIRCFKDQFHLSTDGYYGVWGWPWQWSLGEMPTVLCLWWITDVFQLKIKWYEVHRILCVWWQYWYFLYR